MSDLMTSNMCCKGLQMTSSDSPRNHHHLTEKKNTAMASECGHNKDFLSHNKLKWAIRFLLAYFGIRLVYFSLNISSFAPPDEVTHAGLCKIFSTVFLFPANSPTTYKFGLVTNIPWLYYWTMGKMLHLNIFGITDLVFLRLLNIPLAIGTVWYILRLLRLLTSDRLTQILLVVISTNTAMFSFLSASVSYDNLTNFFAAMAVYYLFAFFKERSSGLLVASILCQLAGCLTKVTFLPLFLILGMLLLIFEVKNLRTIPNAVRNYFQSARRSAWITTLIILFTAGLNLHLYAGNYITYGTLAPGITDVAPKGAMQYRITARDTIFRRYSEGNISFMEALQLAGDIEHPGDKSDTFYILMNYEKLRLNPNLWMGPLQYSKVWFKDMAASTFGIKGHLHMFKASPYLIPIHLLMALSLLGFFIRWRPRESEWATLGLAALTCCYTGYLMYKVNYGAYLHYGTPGVTLNGRYLFPLIGPVCALSCYYLLRLFRSDYIRYPLALATALLFITYDFPWFLVNATAQWYEWLPK